MEVAWNGFDNRECDEFKAALEHMGWLAHKGGVRGALRKDNLDALILPTCVTKYSSSWWVPDHHNSSGVLFCPKDTEIKMCARGDLIERGPNLPFGLGLHWRLVH
ncbi:amidase [Penicillium angulare]|uniref:amidase n=1 Tax=Penicillium angulare TaxID=116970 RepID=UPI0025409332|nr:amidase [Penicillium angulare]KAJ5267085.1 amidase [Penicillium angulare]